MGWINGIIKDTNDIIDEMESDSDISRSQSFLEKFLANRKSLVDAIESSNGEEKNYLSSLLKKYNRKGEENDMEAW